MSGRAGQDGERIHLLHLRSEFGSITVALDASGNGPRLEITNCANGRRILLDPLELASLTWLTHADLGPFLDPSNNGWSGDE
jgi:hypothetical protein